MRTEGAFLVSAARRDGKTQWIRIESLAGEPCRLKCDIDKPQADHDVSLKPASNGVVEISLKKGESVIVYPGGEKPEPIVEPVQPQSDQVNSFGLP
jgi:hypothetical protein